MNDPHCDSSDRQPSAVDAGLDLFAAAWLETWAEMGGYVTIEADGRASLGYPDAPDPIEGQTSYDPFADGRHHGEKQAMARLLKSVPNGRDALKAHMVAHGLRYYVKA